MDDYEFEFDDDTDAPGTWAEQVVAAEAAEGHYGPELQKEKLDEILNGFHGTELQEAAVAGAANGEYGAEYMEMAPQLADQAGLELVDDDDDEGQDLLTEAGMDRLDELEGRLGRQLTGAEERLILDSFEPGTDPGDLAWWGEKLKARNDSSQGRVELGEEIALDAEGDQSQEEAKEIADRLVSSDPSERRVGEGAAAAMHGAEGAGEEAE